MSNISGNQFVYADLHCHVSDFTFCLGFHSFSTFAEVTMNSSIPQWHYLGIPFNSFSILDNTKISRWLRPTVRVTHGLGRPFQVYDITIIFS